MLTTLLDPSGGTATVAGHDLRREPVAVRRSIGYVAQGGSTTPEATVTEDLVFHARLYGISKAEAAQRAAGLLDQLDLGGLGDRIVRTLSGGQRRRLDIALGLVHAPALVFLDEPTSGLDPQSRSNLWHHVRALRDRRGATVFLTTHYLEEADALCDRILVIDNGEIVAAGTPEELKRRVSGDLVTLAVVDRIDEARVVAARQPGARALESDGTTIRLRVERGDRAVVALLREFDAAGLSLEGIQVHRPTLDDVFLTLTGRTLRDDAAA